jgi:methionyl-tRNA formyltransferase
MIQNAPRILYLGMENYFSLQAFKALSAQKVNICGTVISMSASQRFMYDAGAHGETISDLPMVNPHMHASLSQEATDQGVPVVSIAREDFSTISDAIDKTKPDIACVACFPYILPRWLLSKLGHGFLNLHPSILPYHRGPAPLFWIFRSGEMAYRGVTVHLIGEGVDTGDILLQRRIIYEPGISGHEAERVSGAAGGQLLAAAAQGLFQGKLDPYPQAVGGSYQGWPEASDFVLSSSWTVYRAFDFMRATEHWGFAYPIEIDGRTVELTRATSAVPGEYMPASWQVKEDTIVVRFSDGFLLAERR